MGRTVFNRQIYAVEPPQVRPQIDQYIQVMSHVKGLNRKPLVMCMVNTETAVISGLDLEGLWVGRNAK